MIYIIKDKENEYRFNDWYEVIDYAKDRINEDKLMQEMNEDIHKFLQQNDKR